MPTRQCVKWYVNGLRFECVECGNCCAGPAQGYIWISAPEVARLAAFVGMSEDEVRRRCLRRVKMRTTIIEQARTKDCIFLTKTSAGRGCAIYPVRPNQCRTWPFWTANLQTPAAWTQAGGRCPGIDRGRLYSFDEIETLRKQTRWWDDEPGR